MKDIKESIVIDEVKYIRADSVKESVENAEGLPLVLVRTARAGVHYGYLKAHDGMMVTLVNAKRIWCWYGAASLSQLAMEGVKAHRDTKISVSVDKIILTEAIEIINISNIAKDNLDKVLSWKN